MTTVPRLPITPWRRCKLCEQTIFKSPQEFKLHIRQSHCKKEGGSYVCSYGRNDVCSSLPLEGVSERDYEFHVAKQHVLVLTDDENKVEGEQFVENLCQKYQHILSANPGTQPNVVMDKYKWTIYDSTLILPNILNDPRRTKREGDLFTKSWGDGFVESAPLAYSPYVYDIDPGYFDAYLKHAKKHIQHSKKSQSKRRMADTKKDKSGHLLSNISGNASIEIEDVPKVFMQSEFHLEDADVFNAVFPWSQLYGHMSLDKGVTPRNSVKLLQEKMSYYLDLVEVQIAKQISLRSEAFFHAMTSHDALMDQLTHVIHSVCALRERIQAIEEVIVKVPMKVLRLKMRQGNYVQVYNKLKLMATVHQTQPTIQLLLRTSEFVGALDLIFTTQEVLVQEMAGVHCFRHLSSQLAEMEKLIGKMMQTDFMRYITADLNRPPTEINVMEEDRLVAILLGMLRQNHFGFMQTFKDECYTAIDAAVKQSVIEIISEAEDVELENNTGNLPDQVQSLSLARWLDLVKSVLRSLTFLLTRIRALYVVIDEVSDVAAGHVPKGSVPGATSQCHSVQLLDGEIDIKISDQDYSKLKADLKDVIRAVCDHAHDGCANIFTSKSKDGSLDKLATADFVLLAKNVEQFQVYCEGVCGRQSTPLRLALQNQATRFACRFHEERKTKLGLLLENEQWRQADVPVEFQDLVDNIVATGLVISVKKKSSAHVDAIRKPLPYIVVNNEMFVVVGTALMLLKMVTEYCQCAEDVPMLAIDLASRLAELLKGFNSKTCQLMLGAGALQILGLKTITTKHLALTSRCLKLITYFIPQVKNHFCQKMPSKQEAAIKHFDHVIKVYTEHMGEINSKMESIISEMFEAQLCLWEVKAPVPSTHFRMICKQIGKFHEVLLALLPPQELQTMFRRVNDIFKSKMRKHLARLQISIDGGPQHGLVTQELTFYTQRLKDLNLDFSMNDLWNSS